MGLDRVTACTTEAAGLTVMKGRNARVSPKTSAATEWRPPGPRFSGARAALPLQCRVRNVLAGSRPETPYEITREGTAMQIDKQFVVDELKKQGESAKAQKALDELPAKIDHEQHAALLEKFGIDPGQLAEKAAKEGIAGL